MNRALLVAQREYFENVKTKGFWFGILMMPIMLVLIAIVPILVESTRSAKHYSVIDHSGWLLTEIEAAISTQDLSIYLSQPISESHRTPLDGLKRRLESHEITDRKAIATHLLDPALNPQSFSASLPTEITRQILTQHDEIKRWWKSLSVKEKSGLAPRISTNRFILDQPISGDINQQLETLNQQITDGDLFAYFVINEAPLASEQSGRYVSNNLTDTDLSVWFSRHATDIVRQHKLERENIDRATGQWINQPASFESLQIKEDGLEKTVSTEAVIRQWAPVVFVYLLWISILINTHMLLTNTIEEKSNKLIEVLLSSISPITLMAGKIIGIAATGLTIIFSWAIMASLFFGLLPTLIGINLPFNLAVVAADPFFLGSFLVYFILGYLLYAAILVGLGSVCNSLKEAQNLMLPVQLVQMLPIMLMIPIGRDPNGLMAQILSYIPPLTPFVMMNRAAGPPSTFEYIVTTALLIASIVIALWFGAKIFRIGILMTGKPPSPLQIFKLLWVPVVSIDQSKTNLSNHRGE